MSTITKVSNEQVISQLKLDLAYAQGVLKTAVVNKAELLENVYRTRVRQITSQIAKLQNSDSKKKVDPLNADQLQTLIRRNYPSTIVLEIMVAYNGGKKYKCLLADEDYKDERLVGTVYISEDGESAEF